MSPFESAQFIPAIRQHTMMLDEHLRMPLDRLDHALPYGLSKSPHHCVVMVEIHLGPLIMVPEREHRRPQIVQKLPTLIDVVHVVICSICVARVGQCSSSECRQIVRITQVDHMRRLVAVAETQDRSQRLLVGPRSM